MTGVDPLQRGDLGRRRVPVGLPVVADRVSGGHVSVIAPALGAGFDVIERGAEGAFSEPGEAGQDTTGGANIAKPLLDRDELGDLGAQGDALEASGRNENLADDRLKLGGRFGAEPDKPITGGATEGASLGAPFRKPADAVRFCGHRPSPRSLARSTLSRGVWTVEAARAGHINRIANRMRAIDRLETQAQGHGPREALRLGFASSVLCWTALCDGKPEAMFGLVVQSLIGGVGRPWMLGTDNLGAAMRELVRWSPRFVAAMEAETPLLENYVAIENHRSIRYLKHLGFAVAGDPVTIGGVPMLHFSKGA